MTIQFRQRYDLNIHERLLMMVDILIFHDNNHEIGYYDNLSIQSLQLLLIKRGEHPFLGKSALSGEFVSI